MMEATEGLEPTIPELQSGALPAWLRGHHDVKLVGSPGLEPGTKRL